ncbi:galectin-3-like [Periplaneta americana]|uniref:galectin-3-like n=1 Tax=Periplaneta americana TaxID=6978 RepID=UPI0037E93691
MLLEHSGTMADRLIFALLVLLAAVFCTMSAPQQPLSAGDQKNKDGSVNMRFFPGSYPGVVAGSYPGAYPGGYIGGIPSYYGGVPPVLPGGFPPVYQGNYPAVAPGIPAYPGVYGRPFVQYPVGGSYPGVPVFYNQNGDGRNNPSGK